MSFDVNAFDYLMLTVLVAFMFTGALRGFVLEVLSLVLWPVSAFIAWLFAEPAASWFDSLINEPQLRLVAAFVVVFLVVFLIGTVVVYFVNRILPLRGALRTPNVVLGGIVGLLRGGIILVIVFLVAGITALPQRTWWRESLFAPHLQRAAVSVKQYLPQDVARHIRYG
ncbi:CvpA family protein [Sulfurifustis variabilis]|uniref:CvpA family protein n=1 Tax=Sulfurifustis variabilis TaxID=1675686 RepID=UPI000BBAB847|nr:CvpA family protein [Sulfurifustis variabilis]